MCLGAPGVVVLLVVLYDVFLGLRDDLEGVTVEVFFPLVEVGYLAAYADRMWGPILFYAG